METLTLTAIISVAVSAAVSGLIAFLYQRQLLKAQFKFNQRLQEIEFQNDIRQKASIVAEMFSIWVHSSESGKELSHEERQKLNKLCWECSFWLPDKIALDIHKRLSNHSDAKDLKEIIMDVRQYLNPNSSKIDWQNIVHF